MAGWTSTIYQVAAYNVALMASVFSLDTPVLHVMMLDRTRRGPLTNDLEKQIDPGSRYIGKNDGLFAATRKLWKQDSWKGFCKGSLPQYFLRLVPIGVSLIADFLTRGYTAKRTTGFRWFLNYLLARLASNLIQCLISSPAMILKTRLRLSPASRTTRQELRYLWFRNTVTDWFSTEIVLPALFRLTVYDIICGVAALIVPPVSMNVLRPGLGSTRDLLLDNEEIRASVMGMLGDALSFPFLRCQELAAVNLKPMEDASVCITEYKGFSDEIVRDSAWDGFKAYMHLSLLRNISRLPLSNVSLLQHAHCAAAL